MLDSYDYDELLREVDDADYVRWTTTTTTTTTTTLGGPFSAEPSGLIVWLAQVVTEVNGRWDYQYKTTAVDAGCFACQQCHAAHFCPLVCQMPWCVP